MKLINAFFRLIRLQNLLIIVITQVLFYYALIAPLIDKGIHTILHINHFLLLILSSVFIAAAGNIINDYFDLNIDQINKPDRKVIDKHIKRRWAIVMHIVFSLVGIIIGFYIDFSSKTYWLGFSNLVCAFLLFGYSISLKKKLLAGNILISVLTAWVIIVCFLFYQSGFYCEGCNPNYFEINIRRFIRISFLYVAFAFIISLIREVIKDMEDMEGDIRYGCKTMPIVWGIPASKMFVAVWMMVLIGSISIVQFYVLQFGWWWSTAYCILFIILPLLITLQKLYHANISANYKQLSKWIKFVMVTGLLSLLFFKIYS